MKEYNISEILAQEGITKAIKRYGLEGTEDKIKSVYKLMPNIKKLMLEELWKKIRQ